MRTAHLPTTTRLTVAPDSDAYNSDSYSPYSSPSNSPSPVPTNNGAAAGPTSTVGTLVRFLCRRKCLKHALSIGALMLILSPALLSLLYPQLRPGYVPPNATPNGALSHGGLGSDLSVLSSSEDADSSHPSRERTAGELKAHLMSRAHLDWNELDWRASAPHVAWAIPVGGKTERLPQLENLVRSLLAQGAPLSSIHIFEDTGSRVPSGPSVALGALAHKLGVRLHDSAVARLGGEERREEFGINLAKHYAFMMDTILLPPPPSAATTAAAASASSRSPRTRSASGRALSFSSFVTQGYGFNSDPAWTAGSFGLGFRHVVFLEDDLLLAPDAVKYFLSFSNLLEVDTSIFCVSAHNDNAFRSTVRSNAQSAVTAEGEARKVITYDESLGFDFKRGGHFMAPGFLISARVYSFLRPIWFDRGAPLKPKRGSAVAAATTTPPSQWTLRFRREFRMPNGNWDAFLDSRVGSMECIYPRIPRIAHRGAGGFTVSANTQAELYDNLVLSDLAPEAVQYGDLRRMEQSHYRSHIRNFIDSCIVLHSITRLRHETLRGQRVCILVPTTSDADSVWSVLFTHVLGLVSVGGHAGFGKQRGVHEGTVLLELLDNQVLFIGLHSHYRLDVSLKMQQDREALLESLTPRAQAEAAADFIADGIGIKPLAAKVLSDAHSAEYLEIMNKLFLASPPTSMAGGAGADIDHQASSLTGSISAEDAGAARESADAAAAKAEAPLFEILNQNLTDAASSAHFLSLGCFHDGSRSSRDLVYHVPRLWPLTPMRCVLVCELLGFRFAGVQWGHECWCGNHYGRFSGTDAQGNAQQRRAQCDAPCANDESQQKRDWRIRRWQQSVNIQRQGVNNPFDASAPSLSSTASSFTPPFSPHSTYSSESNDEGGCGGAMSNSIYSVFHPPLEGLEAFPPLAPDAQQDHDHPVLQGSPGSAWNGATDSVLSMPRHMLPAGVHFVAASHVQAKDARAARAAAATKAGTQAVAGLSCDEVCVAFGTEQREHPYRCSDTHMPLLAQNCPALQRMLGCASCQAPESALEGFAAPGRLILPAAAAKDAASSACILSKGKYERCDWAPADSAFVRACVCTRVG